MSAARTIAPLLLASLLLPPATAGGHDPGVGWVAAAPSYYPTQVTASMHADGSAYLSRSWAVQELWATRDGGITWAPLQRPSHAGFMDTRMGTGTTGYTAWSGNGDLERTDDGGRTWRFIRTPTAAPGTLLHYSDNLGVAPGSRVVSIGALNEPLLECNRMPRQTYVFTSPNGGRSWHRAVLPAGVVQTIEYADERHGALFLLTDENEHLGCGGWTVGGSVSTVFVTSDGGRSWRPVRRECHCYALAWATHKHLLVGHWTGEIDVSTNQGRTWATYGIPDQPQQTMNGLTGLAMTAEGRGFALTAWAGVWHTTNFGRTWHLELSPAGPNEGAIATVNGETAIADASVVMRRVPGAAAPAGAAMPAPPGPPLEPPSLTVNRRGSVVEHRVEMFGQTARFAATG